MTALESKEEVLSCGANLSYKGERPLSRGDCEFYKMFCSRRAICIEPRVKISQYRQTENGLFFAAQQRGRPTPPIHPQKGQQKQTENFFYETRATIGRPHSPTGFILLKEKATDMAPHHPMKSHYRLPESERFGAGSSASILDVPRFLRGNGRGTPSSALRAGGQRVRLPSPLRR